MTRAADVMTSSPTTIPSYRTVDEATHLMDHLAMRHLPVVDADGVLVGMLSDRDLRGPRIRNGLHGRPAPTTPVDAIMSRSPMRAGPDTDVDAIAQMLLDGAIGAVAIVDPRGVPIGLVSYVDLLRHLH
jgi:CBS-domain-containing membrane protein